METLASQAEIGGCLAPRTGGASVEVRGCHLRKKFEIVYAKSCKLVHFWPENGSKCRLQCVLNTLTMGTPFPCVTGAIQQWKRRSHVLSLEMTPDLSAKRQARFVVVRKQDCIQLAAVLVAGLRRAALRRRRPRRERIAAPVVAGRRRRSTNRRGGGRGGADAARRRHEHLLDRPTAVEPGAVAVVIRTRRAATVHLHARAKLARSGWSKTSKQSWAVM